jgi:hypothetical protein
MPGRHNDRPATMSLHRDGKERVTPVSTASREEHLKPNGGVGSPLKEPRQDADRRARCVQRAPHPKMRLVTTTRLSAFCLLSLFSFFFVIAGLDPAIHAEGKLDRISG